VPPKTVLPEKAAMPLVPPPMRAVPRMAVLVAVAFTVASPVGPMSPELSEVTTGLAVAVELAAPVLPVLVAEDWAVAAPEGPEDAHGSTVRLAPPPLPPLARAVVSLLPPVAAPTMTALDPPLMVGLMVTMPPSPPVAVAEPPSPPSPPVTVPPTTLKALPVVPEVATAPELAPELARLLADAEVTVAEPVKPELPATTKEPV